jgi:hypothetical protein
MASAHRLVALLTVGGLLLFAVPFLPAWLAPLGADLPGLDSAGRILQGEGERGARLEAEREVIARRHLDLERIIEDLIAERLTLKEAAERLRAAQDDNPAFWVVVRLRDQGASDEENLYHHLLSIVDFSLADEPERARSVRRRLEAELQVVLAGGGPVAAP